MVVLVSARNYVCCSSPSPLGPRCCRGSTPVAGEGCARLRPAVVAILMNLGPRPSGLFVWITATDLWLVGGRRMEAKEDRRRERTGHLILFGRIQVPRNLHGPYSPALCMEEAVESHGTRMKRRFELSRYESIQQLLPAKIHPYPPYYNIRIPALHNDRMNYTIWLGEAHSIGRPEVELETSTPASFSHDPTP